MNRIITISVLFFSISVNAQTFDIDTIMYHGNENKFINFVILGDGYRESELMQFALDAEAIADFMFEDSFFSNYREYFNVFMIKVPSNVSGAATDPDNLIDNYFGSTFGYADIDRLLVPTNNTGIVNVLANNFPLYDQVIMLVNSTTYGGSGGWVATASRNSESNEILVHELGHSFSNLADEYWVGDVYAREAGNMTQVTNLADLRWKNWYGDFDIGLYAHSESPSWYRPHQNCKMRFLGSPFCSVCTEITVERIHSLVTPVLSYEPAASTVNPGSFPLRFKLDLIKPEPNTLHSDWKLNGITINSNIDSVFIVESDLSLLSNTLTVSIEDTTQLLRVDNHASIHLSVVSWTIGNQPTGTGNIHGSSGNISVILYPNPADANLTIRISGSITGDIEVDLVDLQGRILQSHLLSPEGDNMLKIGDLDPGTYIAKLYIRGNLIASPRFIKTR
jgi:hypothetical protein